VPRGPAVTRPDVPAFALPADVYATLEDRVQLPRVYDTWHTVRAFADDDAAINALGDILAGGKSSRLYRRLVYEMQIATMVVGFQDAGRLDGKFEIISTARPGHDLNEIQRVIDEEVRRIAETGPTPRELERVQNSDEAQFLDGMERVGGFSGKANQLNYYNYFAGTPDFFQRDLDRYRSLTPADIQRVARQYLAQHRVVLSVVPQGQTNLAVTQGVTP
jgi:zinc protease